MTAKTAAKGGFTPGPWKINDKGAQITIQWFDEKGWGCTVGTIDPDRSSLPMAEIRANARLIAAAPEMYQALQDILGSGSIQEAERIAFAVLDKLKEEAHG